MVRAYLKYLKYTKSIVLTYELFQLVVMGPEIIPRSSFWSHLVPVIRFKPFRMKLFPRNLLAFNVRNECLGQPYQGKLTCFL